MGTKINQLIQQLPAGTILLSAWLNAEGYPYELQQKYRKSGWLTSVGIGAMIHTGYRINGVRNHFQFYELPQIINILKGEKKRIKVKG